jgi:hypothetical protein
MKRKMHTNKLFKNLKIRQISRIADGAILLSINKRLKTTYPIPLDQCSTPNNILAWCVHLLEKRWIKKIHVEQFILDACRINKIELL